MNSYNQEQIEALRAIRQHLSSLPPSTRQELEEQISDYLNFRKQVNDFLVHHFDGICTLMCYVSNQSACCSREGIITFFADMVINVAVSEESELRAMENALQHHENPNKCVYLTPKGCLWRIKPIVCEMFLCDQAQQKVFTQDSGAAGEWALLRRRAKRFRWPDRPVLFDELERFFIKAGVHSPLMYLHLSPGLMRVKQQAGLKR